MPNEVDTAISCFALGIVGSVMTSAGIRHLRGAVPSSPPRTWRTRELRRAYLPAGISFSLLASSLLVWLLVGENLRTAPRAAAQTMVGLLIAGLAFLFVAESVVAFNRPRFLVPPQFRAERGYLAKLRPRRGSWPGGGML